jgi:hypothetical protein
MKAMWIVTDMTDPNWSRWRKSGGDNYQSEASTYHAASDRPRTGRACDCRL